MSTSEDNTPGLFIIIKIYTFYFVVFTILFIFSLVFSICPRLCLFSLFVSLSMSSALRCRSLSFGSRLFSLFSLSLWAPYFWQVPFCLISVRKLAKQKKKGKRMEEDKDKNNKKFQSISSQLFVVAVVVYGSRKNRLHRQLQREQKV